MATKIKFKGRKIDLSGNNLPGDITCQGTGP